MQSDFARSPLRIITIVSNFKCSYSYLEPHDVEVKPIHRIIFSYIASSFGFNLVETIDAQCHQLSESNSYHEYSENREKLIHIWEKWRRVSKLAELLSKVNSHHKNIAYNKIRF